MIYLYLKMSLSYNIIIVPIYSYNFLITIRKTYEELCIKFSSILIGPKKFYRHFK
ncbi:hypothetical protein FWK35_00009135, partial [Aphis craccivora]